MRQTTLGQRLKSAREALGLTQEALGKPDLTKGFISLLEHDRARPSVLTLERLAQRLGKSVSYFLEGGETSVADKTLGVFGARGRAEMARRRYEAALSTFTEMRRIAGSQRNADKEMRAVLGAGEALLGLRRLEEARTMLGEALARGREAKDALTECRALHGLATVDHRNGRFPRAVEQYKNALAVVPTLAGAEPNLHGEILLFMGTVLGRMGRMEEALGAYTQAHQVFDDASRPERVGEALLGLGNILSNTGAHDEALVQYARARALFEQYEDLQMLSYVRNNLGMLLVQIGRVREALEHFAVSLAIKQRLGDAVGESHTLTELARCYFICHRPDRAKEYAEQALAKSRMAPAADEEARAEIVLGAIALEAGDPDVAYRHLHSAVTHCERSAMMPELVMAFRQLARLATRQGRYQDAVGYQEKAFQALRGVGPYDVVAAVHLADLMTREAGAPDTQPSR
ncbi:MAG TPA: tetratricopeptide repeat protein [bacterium]|nr:tetratricopeptide repeat protein [bacterium]